MNQEQRAAITKMRNENKGYKLIASAVGLTRDDVRSYCKRHNMAGKRGEVTGKTKKKNPKRICASCGTEYQYAQGTSFFKYCSVGCRNNKPNKSKMAECKHCGKSFEKNSASQKFCSAKHRHEFNYIKRMQEIKVCMNCGKEYPAPYGKFGCCGQGCYNDLRRKSHYDFAKELLEAHNGTIVPLEEYKGSDYNLRCMCVSCGNVMEKIARTYIGVAKLGCINCGKKSHGEDEVESWLRQNDIQYKRQYTEPNIKDINNLYYDFAIYKEGEVVLFIEYDGEQHFKPVEAWGGEEKLKQTVQRDQLKNEIAERIAIPLIRIGYKERKAIGEILGTVLAVS